MIRLLFHIGLFLIPFIVYIMWILLSNGEFTKTRTFWVTIISLLVLSSSLIFSSFFNKIPNDLEYVPPQIINDELKPGHFEKAND